MKVCVTALKAPWPQGAGVGSVVEFDGDAVPAWAAGKCTPAAADAEVTHVFAKAEPAAAEAADDPLAAVEAQAAAERAALSRKGRKTTGEAG